MTIRMNVTLEIDFDETNQEAGRAFAAMIAEWLGGKVTSVNIVETPPMPPPLAKRIPGQREMPDEYRRLQSERMKAYHAERRATKAATEAAALEAAKPAPKPIPTVHPEPPRPRRLVLTRDGMPSVAAVMHDQQVGPQSAGMTLPDVIEWAARHAPTIKLGVDADDFLRRVNLVRQKAHRLPPFHLIAMRRPQGPLPAVSAGD